MKLRFTLAVQNAFPGQCTHSNGCNPGFAPTCATREVECPKTGWVSCSGDCTCEPIPGWDGGTGGTDGGVMSDAALPPPSSDAGCDCPDGSVCVGADDYCASPCGFGEFICPAGALCVEGYCVPECVVTPCKAPDLCDFSTGKCTSDPGANSHPDSGLIVPDSGVDAGDPSDNPAAPGSDDGCSCRSAAVPVGSAGLGAVIAGVLGFSFFARRRRRRAG